MDDQTGQTTPGAPNVPTPNNGTLSGNTVAHVPPPGPPMSQEQQAQFAQFLAWQQSQSAQAPAPAPTQSQLPRAVPQSSGDATTTDAGTGLDKAKTILEGDAQVPNGVFEYDATGDAGLDFALDFVGKLGFGPQHPAMQAAVNGDLSLLRAELAAKNVSGADKVLALAENAYKAFSEKAVANQATLKAFAIETAGSEEAWNQVKNWAVANADPGEAQVIDQAIASGGLMAHAMVSFLIGKFGAGNTPVRAPQAAVTPNATPFGAGGNAGLTGEQYRAAIQKLGATFGFRDPTNSPEYQNLQAQRLAGIRQGLR